VGLEWVWFAPTWLRQVSHPPPLLHKTTLTTDNNWSELSIISHFGASYIYTPG